MSTTQVGTFALVRGICEFADVPVIAAGGIADGRAIAAAFALGASAVQIGTAYLQCPEAYTPPLHSAALADPDRETAITNVLTGRPARGVMNRFMREQGPMNAAAPVLPPRASRRSRRSAPRRKPKARATSRRYGRAKPPSCPNPWARAS